MKFKILAISILIFTSCTDSDLKTENQSKDPYLFVGTYTKKEGHVDGKGRGIEIYKWEDDKARLTSHFVIDGPINPSYIALHPGLPIVYAVNEVADDTDQIIGTVEAYKFDIDNKTSEAISKVSSLGDAPCHISTSPNGKFLFVANYVGGTVVCYHLKSDGSIGDLANLNQNHRIEPNLPRQESAHPHMVRQINDNGTIFISDLGADEVNRFSLNEDGSWTMIDSLQIGFGNGPRHFDVNDELSIVYVLSELTPGVMAIDYSNDSQLSVLQDLNIPKNLDSDQVNSSAIKVHPSGRALFAGLRGIGESEQNEIVVISLDSKGFMKIEQQVSSFGEIPRDFTIDPTGKYLILGNQDTDEVVIYSINQENHHLEMISDTTKIPTPVCFQWFMKG